MTLSEHRPVIRFGTRGSTLARWQTDHVIGLFRDAWPDQTCEITVLDTQGDRLLDTPLPSLGGKGIFTAELESALRSGDIDFAVHSLKDLPTEMVAGLALGAVTVRSFPNDVLVSRARHTFETLPHGATVGTSSRRRGAQLLNRRPDLRLLDVRGNVDTRLRKALTEDGPYDALVLAYAGLVRLGLTGAITQVLPLDIMLPAPGQGALAVQCRDEAESLALLAPLNDEATRQSVDAERAFLAGLGGGCALPIAAFAEVKGNQVHVHGRITTPNGNQQIDVQLEGPAAEAATLGARLAELALSRGASKMLTSEIA
jgi:hydroxymethylbilane synthase